MEVKCHKCNYIWDCNAKTMFVSCPNCNNKTKKIEYVVEYGTVEVV